MFAYEGKYSILTGILSITRDKFLFIYSPPYSDQLDLFGKTKNKYWTADRACQPFEHCVRYKRVVRYCVILRGNLEKVPVLVIGLQYDARTRL